MMHSMKWLGGTAALSGLVLLSMGCVMAGPDDEEVGEAHQAQIDPGLKDYLLYEIKDVAGATIGILLATNTAGAGYAADREYYYMTSNVSNGSAVVFSGGTSEYWSNPPSGLGTLSFVTQRTPTWTSGTPRGTMLLHTNALTGERVGINWQMSNSGGTWTGAIHWWHSNTNDIFGPGTTTTLSPGTPGSGTWYHFTATPL